jgi:glutathione S-transferase
MTRPILYSFRRCPYAMRARLAVAQSGAQVELREVILRDKPSAMLEVSPKGTVPVLILPDGQVIDESYDVMNWALGVGGATDAERALVMQCDAEFKPFLDQYKYPNKQENYDRDKTLSDAGQYLNLLDECLENNDFLFGVERGFADIGIAPFVRQFAHVDRDWFLESEWKNVIKWYREFIEWDGFKSIMTKHPKWVDGDPITVFP